MVILLIGGSWILIVVLAVLYQKNKKITKVIAKKKSKENSPVRRANDLSVAAEEVDTIIDSGNLSIMIQWNKNDEVNPDLLFDLEEDIQEVVYRKNRGEGVSLKKAKKTLTSTINYNNYINLIHN